MASKAVSKEWDSTGQADDAWAKKERNIGPLAVCSNQRSAISDQWRSGSRAAASATGLHYRSAGHSRIGELESWSK